MTAWPKTTSSNVKFTECNDALLRGLSLSSTSSSSGEVLQILNVNPINYQTLNELFSYSESNKFINKLLLSRATFIKDDLLKEFEVYLKADELKAAQM